MQRIFFDSSKLLYISLCLKMKIIFIVSYLQKCIGIFSMKSNKYQFSATVYVHYLMLITGVGVSSNIVSKPILFVTIGKGSGISSYVGQS